MSREITGESGYSEKIYKLIPTEIIAAYMAIERISQTNTVAYPYIVSVAGLVLLILIPFYLRFLSGVQNRLQIVISMGSFIIWAINTGSYLTTKEWYLSIYGTVALILWTLLAPFCEFGSRREPS